MIDFLKENTDKSIMRLCTFIIVVVALLILMIQASFCDTVDWLGCCSLVGLALTGKSAQKALEKKK